MTDRLEQAITRLEYVLVAREAEQERLRRVESAASSALAELDELLGRAV